MEGVVNQCCHTLQLTLRIYTVSQKHHRHFWL